MFVLLFNDFNYDICKGNKIVFFMDWSIEFSKMQKMQYFTSNSRIIKPGLFLIPMKQKYLLAFDTPNSERRLFLQKVMSLGPQWIVKETI